MQRVVSRASSPPGPCSPETSQKGAQVVHGDRATHTREFRTTQRENGHPPRELGAALSSTFGGAPKFRAQLGCLGVLSRRATSGPKSARRTRPGYDAPRAFPPGQAGAEGTPCFLPLSSAAAQACVGVLEGAGSGDPDAGPACFWLSSMLPTSGRPRRRCLDDHARAPAPPAAAEELRAVCTHLATLSA